MKSTICRFRILFALLLLPYLLGCATQGALEPPDLTLVHLQPVEATLFETTLNVQLRVSNPNPEAITLEGASFKLTLDGHKVGRGMTPEIRSIGKFDSEVVEVVFHVSNASVLLRLKGVLESQSVSYGVSGKLYLQRGSGTRKVKVQSAGQIDLSTGTPAPNPVTS